MKQDSDASRSNFGTGRPAGVNVVPAIRLKRGVGDRRADQVSDDIATHADRYAIKLGLADQISLLDGDLVRPWQPDWIATTGAHQDGDQKAQCQNSVGTHENAHEGVKVIVVYFSNAGDKRV